MEDMEFEHDGFLLRRQRLEVDVGGKIGKSGVGGDEYGDSGATLVVFEFGYDSRGDEEGESDVEIVTVD